MPVEGVPGLRQGANRGELASGGCVRVQGGLAAEGRRAQPGGAIPRERGNKGEWSAALNTFDCFRGRSLPLHQEKPIFSFLLSALSTLVPHPARLPGPGRVVTTIQDA